MLLCVTAECECVFMCVFQRETQTHQTAIGSKNEEEEEKKQRKRKCDTLYDNGATSLWLKRITVQTSGHDINAWSVHFSVRIKEIAGISALSQEVFYKFNNNNKTAKIKYMVENGTRKPSTQWSSLYKNYALFIEQFSDEHPFHLKLNTNNVLRF